MFRFVPILAAFLLGCFPPVEETCLDIAESQCQLCSTCGGPQDACGLSPSDDCVQTLSQRCENQASTLEDPKDEVDQCLDAIGTWTCEDFLERAVQGRPTPPDSCTYFL